MQRSGVNSTKDSKFHKSLCSLGAISKLLLSQDAPHIHSSLFCLSSLLVFGCRTRQMYILFLILFYSYCAACASANPIQPTITPSPLLPRQGRPDLEDEEAFFGYWFLPTMGTSILGAAMCNDTYRTDAFFTTSATIGTTWAVCCERYTFADGSTWDCADQVTTACSDGTIAFYGDTSTTW
jgi:hypothetical protein